MLEFYRKHYMTKNKILDAFSIAFYLLGAVVVLYFVDNEILKLKLLWIAVLLLNAMLTLTCMVINWNKAEEE